MLFRSLHPDKLISYDNVPCEGRDTKSRPIKPACARFVANTTDLKIFSPLQVNVSRTIGILRDGMRIDEKEKRERA